MSLGINARDETRGMPVGDPTKVIGIRLTVATLERLRERAAVERRTVAMMAGLIIEDALQPQTEALQQTAGQLRHPLLHPM
jgi:hypothetical protein